MPTAQQIFTQAWVDLGVGAPGQIPPTSQSVNGLSKLNLFIDMLSAARDMIYEIALASYLLNANVATYSIGPTAPAPFNVPRPIKVENANILLAYGDEPAQRSPLIIYTQEQWRQIRDQGSVGTTPEGLYVDPQVPNSVLNLNPIPRCNIPTLLELGTWTAVQQFATLATNANLPPAYYQLLVLGLQLQLVPTYGNLISPAIIQMRENQFVEAVNAVRSLNSAVQLMTLPSTAPVQQTNQSGSNPQLAQLLQELRAGQASQRQG